MIDRFRGLKLSEKVAAIFVTFSLSLAAGLLIGTFLVVPWRNAHLNPTKTADPPADHPSKVGSGSSPKNSPSASPRTRHPYTSRPTRATPKTTKSGKTASPKPSHVTPSRTPTPSPSGSSHTPSSPVSSSPPVHSPPPIPDGEGGTPHVLTTPPDALYSSSRGGAAW